MLESIAPQDVAITTSDGVTLSGTYYPPVKEKAPGVILFHMLGRSREDWSLFAIRLQAAAASETGGSGYAVMAIDLRGHGGSGGTRDRAGMVEDGRAALAYMQSLPDVDDESIIMVGASIGGDVAVNACADGCHGAISLSPGSFTGVDYLESLIALGDKPVLCVAAEADSPSPETCQQGTEANLSDYLTFIYQGGTHGTNMFQIEDQTPPLGDLLVEWLDSHT